MMPLFYHIQRDGVSRFKTGRTYSFGHEQNFFARDLFAVDPRVPVTAVGDLPLDAVLKDYFDPEGFNHFKKIKRPNYTADEKGLLACARAVLNHQAMLLREFVFEQVRQESFPDKPSRLRGIWLIPHHEELLQRWGATAPHGQFRAFEVEADGKFHIGASKYLKPECVGVDELGDRARRYWSEPVDPLRENAELLCAGTIKVLRELQVAGSTQSSWTILKGKLGFR